MTEQVCEFFGEDDADDDWQSISCSTSSGGGCAGSRLCMPQPLNCIPDVCNTYDPVATPPESPAGCLTEVTAGTVIADVMQAAKGMCESDAAPDTFLYKVATSIPLAQNQMDKFQIRYDYLRQMNDENDKIIEIFEKAVEMFDMFLSGPAADLIRARQDFIPNEDGLPYDAIYGWRGKDSVPGSGLADGKWHIVKVEGRLPGNCDNACDINQTGPNLEWPKIETSTYAWGTRRQYDLINLEGSTKFRAIRYDEDSPSNSLLFPNGVPIWQFRGGHPKRPQDGTYDPANLETACVLSTITKLPDGITDTNIYDGAFMTTWRSDDPVCWDLAHGLLSQGVVSETCATYFWTGSRMDFRFVDCREF